MKYTTSCWLKTNALQSIHLDLHEIVVLTIRVLIISITSVEERFLMICEEWNDFYSFTPLYLEYHPLRNNECSSSPHLVLMNGRVVSRWRYRFSCDEWAQWGNEYATRSSNRNSWFFHRPTSEEGSIVDASPHEMSALFISLSSTDSVCIGFSCTWVFFVCRHITLLNISHLILTSLLHGSTMPINVTGDLIGAQDIEAENKQSQIGHAERQIWDCVPISADLKQTHPILPKQGCCISCYVPIQ